MWSSSVRSESEWGHERTPVLPSLRSGSDLQTDFLQLATEGLQCDTVLTKPGYGRVLEITVPAPRYHRHPVDIQVTGGHSSKSTPVQSPSSRRLTCRSSELCWVWRSRSLERTHAQSRLLSLDWPSWEPRSRSCPGKQRLTWSEKMELLTPDRWMLGYLSKGCLTTDILTDDSANFLRKLLINPHNAIDADDSW